MDEFALIEKYFAPLAGPEGLFLKDDTALYRPRPGHDLLITTDCFVESVHFPKGMYGADVAERLLRTNLSDIAAKGGRPLGYQLSVSLNGGLMEKWIPAFAKGLETTQSEFGCTLWGGDMTATSGAAVFSITLIGEVPSGDMISRSGTDIGEDIWVSGVLGDAMLGCRLVLGQPIEPAPSGAEIYAYETAYWRPEPCFAVQKVLNKYATASADISDGVMADIGQIAKSSGVSASLNFDAFPFSLGAERWADLQTDPISAKKSLVSFGDDYGVVFTAKTSNRQAIFDLARESHLKLTLIGSVLSGEGVKCLDVQGAVMEWQDTGYRHIK